LNLRELAERLQCRLDGDGDIVVTRVAGIERAEPGDLTFLANPKYHGFLQTTRASAVLVAPGIDRPEGGPSLLVCDRPYLAFAQALGLLVDGGGPSPGIDPSSVVAADAQLGGQVSIGALAIIGSRARIGARTIVYPGCIIGPSQSMRPSARAMKPSSEAAM